MQQRISQVLEVSSKVGLDREQTKQLAQMVEAKLAQMIQTKADERDSQAYLCDTELAENSLGLKDSTTSYGRRRNLPIEQRSQLWLAMKERKLQGQRS